MRDVGSTSGEHRDAPFERLRGAKAQGRTLDDDVRNQAPVGVEVRIALDAPRDEDAPPSRDGWDGGTAAVEEDEIGLQLGGEACSCRDVRDRDAARETAARATAADRRDAGERRDLEVIRCSVAA